MKAVRGLAAVVMLALASAAGPAKAASPYINMSETAYQPATVNVDVNDDVFWCNPSSQDHTVHADDGSFIKDFPANSQCSGRTFQVAGSFPYHCTIVSGMRGTVNVGGAATTAATRPAATANTTTATSTKRTTTTNRVATTRPSTSTVSSDEPTTGTEAVTSSTQRQLAIATKDTPSSGPPLAAPLVGAVTLVGLGYLAYRWRYPRTQ